VYTDELKDQGQYEVYVTATADVTAPGVDVDNTAMSFVLNLNDPCDSTLVNNIVADTTLNRVG